MENISLVLLVTITIVSSCSVTLTRNSGAALTCNNNVSLTCDSSPAFPCNSSVALASNTAPNRSNVQMSSSAITGVHTSLTSCIGHTVCDQNASTSNIGHTVFGRNDSTSNSSFYLHHPIYLLCTLKCSLSTSADQSCFNLEYCHTTILDSINPTTYNIFDITCNPATEESYGRLDL